MVEHEMRAGCMCDCVVKSMQRNLHFSITHSTRHAYSIPIQCMRTAYTVYNHGLTKRIKFDESAEQKNTDNNRTFAHTHTHKKPRMFYSDANAKATNKNIIKKCIYIVHKRYVAIPLDVQIKLCLRVIIIILHLFFAHSVYVGIDAYLLNSSHVNLNHCNSNNNNKMRNKKVCIRAQAEADAEAQTHASFVERTSFIRNA